MPDCCEPGMPMPKFIVILFMFMLLLMLPMFPPPIPPMPPTFIPCMKFAIGLGVIPAIPCPCPCPCGVAFDGPA